MARVFLLFPDPWPKSRHAERRFIGPANLDSLARIMLPGAELRVATDDPTYLAWTLEHLPAHPEFRWRAGAEAEQHQRPADWPATRYEQKALREGRPPAYLKFERRGGVVGLTGAPSSLYRASKRERVAAGAQAEAAG